MNWWVPVQFSNLAFSLPTPNNALGSLLNSWVCQLVALTLVCCKEYCKNTASAFKIGLHCALGHWKLAASAGCAGGKAGVHKEAQCACRWGSEACSLYCSHRLARPSTGGKALQDGSWRIACRESFHRQHQPTCAVVSHQTAFTVVGSTIFCHGLHSWPKPIYCIANAMSLRRHCNVNAISLHCQCQLRANVHWIMIAGSNQL